MLLRFKFSNFRSFRSEQELSLVAGSLNDHSEGVFEIPGLKERALPVAAIYGANASGKTTVLRALQFMNRVIRQSHRLWEPEQPIPLEPFAGEGPETPTRFGVDFIHAGIRHQYGFAVNSAAVLEEWLHVYPKGKKQTWFNRKAGSPISFGEKLAGENRVIEQLTRNNSLFLSAAAQNNHEMLLPVYDWFWTNLVFVTGDRSEETKQTIKMCEEDRETRALITRLLSGADLGIADLTITTKRPSTLAEKIADSMLQHPPARSVKLVHRINGGLLPLELEQESAGTAAYLALLGPLVEALRWGGVICIDELYSSLHPLIATEIMRFFENRGQNPRGAQLIFNTHDANLLNTGILRRDQIWFTEKDAKGESHLYPLTDFKPRRQENLESGYLQGRYGAIPFIHSDEFVTSLPDGDGETK
jgi:energy-coupling factor transporter ATP-binding protein EcfA2